MSAIDLEAHISAIMERIDDLRSFDVAPITQRYDPRVQELCDSVNETIADIFGRDTRAYWQHSLPSFEASHAVLGISGRSAGAVRGSYKEGINKAVKKLTALAESLKLKLDHLELQNSRQKNR